ncbi:MAG TPA: radical SAM protein [Lachnospiraceae bacterium]|nr:radical SAM protein [Lachnospiraceae bacterium]
MHFSSGINRPPYEAQDAFLQITSGCSHGDCAFCTFYKDAPFRISPIETVEEDIKELASGWYYPFNRIYLQGADPFIAPYDYLKKVADLIHKYLPNVKSIGGYARVDNVRNKTVEQLRDLVKEGYSNFYFGNETGDDYLLERMNKGYRAEDVVRYMSMLDEAGMEYIMNFLGGLGGHNYGLSHAQKSAEVINQLHPTMVYASELTLFPDTPLSKDVKEGLFTDATEEERFVEMKEFINCLTTPTVFKAEHVTIPVPVRGRLPEDKQDMIGLLDRLIERAKAGELKHFRDNVAGL